MISYFKRHLRNFKNEIVNELMLRQSISNLTYRAQKDETSGVSDIAYFGDDKRVIVSLTTYSKRIYDVFLVVETLFSQTLKANKIILWLDENEFCNETIPLILKHQKQRGLEIRFCKNLYSFKKLVPTLKEFPEDVIITVDDDILYPFDFLERMVMAYKKLPSYVYFARGSMIQLDNNGKPIPYLQWGKMRNKTVYRDMCKGTPLAFPTGCGGVLYPPNSLHKDVFREDLFMKLCPKADDMWFKIMSLKAGMSSCLVPLYNPDDSNLISLPDNQEISLNGYNNNTNNMNDVQLKAILDYYNTTIANLVNSIQECNI